MLSLLSRYARWLHGQWPAGKVEKLPRVREDGSTNVAGLSVAGDLTGIPLLKFAADSGARAVADCEPAGDGVLDLVIIGAGVAGVSAAIEATKKGLAFEILEAAEPFATLENFPAGKPIFAYPEDFEPAGELDFGAPSKEPLLVELEGRRRAFGIEPRRARAERVRRAAGKLEVVLGEGEPLVAHRVLVAIGRSGNHRKLGVPGEALGKVSNRLHDPKDFADKDVCVVGGGDSAVECAIAIALCGGRVTLAHRGKELTRPKPANLERLAALAADPGAPVQVETPVSERVTTAAGVFLGAHLARGSLRVELETEVDRVDERRVRLRRASGEAQELPNDAVFSMIGREAPLDFFRKSGVRIRGETAGFEWLAILVFFLAIWWVYDWKSEGFVSQELPGLAAKDVFPKNAPALVSGLGDSLARQVADRSTLVGTLAVSMKSRSFYYTLAYTLALLVFGYLRVRKRRTPYVTLQTAVLVAVQVVPLFLLPEVILPWLGYNGFFDTGIGRWLADNLFELHIPVEDYLAQRWPDWGHPRAYWRAYGLVLAWPLMIYNVFTQAPIWGWLGLSVLQTFVLLPLLVRKWGKGAYCGWLCSCGGLAETLGDAQRHRMPHGPRANRVNLVGQVLLLVAFVLLALHVVGWIFPTSFIAAVCGLLVEGKTPAGDLVNPLSWKWGVDVFLAGVLSVGLYFKFSGRVWCRFACPLAALLHVYARFSRFRILADKKKCISCNACTATCHMGIDVMNFANKGVAMADPECVRCSACVEHCPTGVLAFGEVDPKSGAELRRDRLRARGGRG